MSSGKIFEIAENVKYHSRYLVNDAYNRNWVYKFGIPANEPLSVSEMSVDLESKAHAQPFMTVWLKNIDRLLAPLRGTADQYDFIDVGCGRGVAAIYVEQTYNFKSVSGLDFEPKLVADARNNLAAAREFHDVRFFVADASEYFLEDQKQVVFMFNPFDAPVMDAFMRNNIENLRDNRSVIAYANHKQLSVINQYEPAFIKEVSSYNCSLIAFS